MTSLPSVLKLHCLPLLGAGLLFACSAEDPGSSESGGTAAAGTGGTISTGGTAESGGTTGSTGGLVESTGATTGGGVEIGGGATTGGGGASTGGGATGDGGTETGGATTGGATGGTVSIDFELPPPNDFTEDQVPGVTFDMVYVPGGTFILGCESEPCPANTEPVEGVTVSSYHIATNEVTSELWNAVMGEGGSDFGGPSITWYDSMAFACQLSQMTGRAYRMMTEAEFEYAAKNYLDSLQDIGSGEEWAYNSWSGTHMGGTDPVGPNSGVHTQKTRRDAQGTGDNITGRLIRSIDGIGPQLRLVISAETDFPPDYVPPCELHQPVLPEEPVNSYRDPRWITGGDAHWSTGSDFGVDLRVWEDGTATMGNMMGGATQGQWFTSNNIAFVFVPNSGDITKLAYIFLDEAQGSIVSASMFVGRIYKEAADPVEKPAIADLRSGAELAAAAGPEFAMVDMENIPEAAKEQDPRLIDGPGQGWSQKNVGSQHHYRKDVDPEEFRFTVNQDGNRIMLANGTWFTVGDTFLRVTHADGYTCDYLYAITDDGMFLHDSFQGYERGDFRGFRLETNGPEFNDLCGEICNEEIPMGEPASFYATMAEGASTFVPAPCPTGGCQ